MLHIVVVPYLTNQPTKLWPCMTNEDPPPDACVQAGYDSCCVKSRCVTYDNVLLMTLCYLHLAVLLHAVLKVNGRNN